MRAKHDGDESRSGGYRNVRGRRENDQREERARRACGRLPGAGRKPRGPKAGREEVAALARVVPTFTSIYSQRLRMTSTLGQWAAQYWAGWGAR